MYLSACLSPAWNLMYTYIITKKNCKTGKALDTNLPYHAKT